MSDTNTKRERDKIRELARDYRKNGFEVFIEPKAQSLPPFLRQFDYTPDLIATSDHGSYIVEVSSRDTADRLRALSQVVDAIEENVQWEFVLVMTNPRSPRQRTVTLSALDLEDLQTPLANVQALSELSKQSGGKYDHAVLLAAWAVIEAALRMYLYSNKPEKQGRQPRSIVRDAVMYGFITPSEGQFLDDVVQTRNGIAHGALTEVIPRRTLDRLLKLADHLARQLDENDA